MCGIAGIWFSHSIGSDVLELHARQMGSVLAHRGPDAGLVRQQNARPQRSDDLAIALRWHVMCFVEHDVFPMCRAQGFEQISASKALNRREQVRRHPNPKRISAKLIYSPPAEYRPQEDDFFADDSPGSELQACSKVVAELCERLAELDVLKYGLGIDLLQRLARLANISPTAFRITTRMLHGDESAAASHSMRRYNPA